MKCNVTLHCGNQTSFYASIARIEVEMPPAERWSLAWPSNDDRQSSQMITWLSIIELNAWEAPDVTQVLGFVYSIRKHNLFSSILNNHVIIRLLWRSSFDGHTRDHRSAGGILTSILVIGA